MRQLSFPFMHARETPLLRELRVILQDIDDQQEMMTGIRPARPFDPFAEHRRHPSDPPPR